MDESQKQNETNNEEQYESYGWEFHKYPLMYAAVMSLIFYAFIFIYFNMD